MIYLKWWFCVNWKFNTLWLHEEKIQFTHTHISYLIDVLLSQNPCTTTGYNFFFTYIAAFLTILNHLNFWHNETEVRNYVVILIFLTRYSCFKTNLTVWWNYHITFDFNTIVLFIPGCLLCPYKNSNDLQMN